MAAVLTLATVAKIVGKALTAKPKANASSVIVALDRFGKAHGLDLPHRQAQYIAQLLHESAAFVYDQEIASGAAYEGRKDLGNVQKGDGRRYKGRGPIQITGRSNYRQFAAWARKLDKDAPDFEAKPEAVNTDPWEGLGPIWYWSTRGLNRYADQGDVENITRKINGGLNGYADRLHWYDRTALVMLGYDPTDIAGFQKDAKRRGDYTGAMDGEAGPKTRAAMHKALVSFTPRAEQPKDVAAAPVEVEKQIVPEAVEKEVKQKTGWLTTILTGLFGGGVGLGWLKDADWQTLALLGGGGLVVSAAVLVAGEWIVRRIKAIRAEIAA